MNDLQIFNYGEIPVRTVLRDGEPWWVLKDVCQVLELSEPHRVAMRLDEDERTLSTVTDRMGRHQNTTIISESGLYTVILRSDKPEAKSFRRWVTHEVLPSIRRTGTYSTAPAVSQTVEQRQLTTDDYIGAARIVSDCRNERLPYVLGFLKCGGFEIPEVEARVPEKLALGSKTTVQRTYKFIDMMDYL